MTRPALPRLAALFSLLAASAAPLPAALPVDVVTYHNDAGNTGQYPRELTLTRANVTAATFGKKFDAKVDGQMYAQPLYVAGLVIPGKGRHNVVYAATEHDSVYAFDADTGALLWHRLFLGTNTNGVVYTTVPYTEVPGQCTQITPEIGITATPALDVASGTIYVAAMTKETSADGKVINYFQRIHALDIATGKEKPNSPKTVTASVPGTGDGGTADLFIPLNYKARPGLVLVNGVLYTSWSSHCDSGTYHGWIIGYDATTLQQVSVFNVTPNGSKASVWNGGASPAVDAAGNIFTGVGEGTFDAQNEDGSLNPSGVDFGESYIRFSTANRRLSPVDWFTPFNKDDLITRDKDTGSAGMVLYDVGNAHLAACAGKEGRIYILNRDNMGHYTPGADNGAVQTIPPSTSGITSGLWGCPAFFNSAVNGPTLYFSSNQDRLRAFVLDPVTGKITGPATSSTTARFPYPGSAPIISSHQGVNGILWMLEFNAVLHAFDADNVARELYNTTQAPGGRDALGSYVKFTTPIISQGKVFAGTADHLGVYGLLNPPKGTDATADVTVEVVSSAVSGNYLTQQVRLTNHGAKALTQQVSLVLDGLDESYALGNATGTTTETTPRASFYANATLTDGTLAVGASTTVTLKFTPSTYAAPAYTARVLVGGGSR